MEDEHGFVPEEAAEEADSIDREDTAETAVIRLRFGL